MATLALNGVTKAFGPTRVLHGIDLDIGHGEFVVFVGPSGCGKSTLLRLIAGLEQVTGGTISIDGAVVNDVPAAQRGLAMVFQSYALYPHMSVRQNLSFGLENIRTPKAQIARRVAEAARMLRMEALLDRRPGQLSGGQRQRVSPATTPGSRCSRAKVPMSRWWPAAGRSTAMQAPMAPRASCTSASPRSPSPTATTPLSVPG
jgi:multiple sugar transport system ATP-binding protein